MSRIHRIRLGPPWEVTPLPDGRVRHLRRFGRPRTLDANERLKLVCERVVTASVNGVELGTASEFDLTPLLQPRNEVVIEMAADEPLGEVALEVWGDAG